MTGHLRDLGTYPTPIAEREHPSMQTPSPKHRGEPPVVDPVTHVEQSRAEHVTTYREGICPQHMPVTYGREVAKHKRVPR